MDVIMRWLSLFCFGYTYYELCTTIKLDLSCRIRIRMRMGLALWIADIYEGIYFVSSTTI